MSEIIPTKICTRCQVEKSLSEFYKRKYGLSGQCKVCRAIYLKTYKIEHKHELSKKQHLFHIEHRDARNAQTKRCYMAKREINKQKRRDYYRDHKKQHAKACKLYLQTDEGRNASNKSKQKRRALKLANTVEDFSPIEIFKRDNYICQICGIKTRPDFKSQYHPKRPELDHIIPLSCGGDHSRLNCQCLCRTCNATKRNREDFGDQLRMFG